jgi:hypothetical protein
MARDHAFQALERFARRHCWRYYAPLAVGIRAMPMSLNRLSSCASSNRRYMLTFIDWFNNVVNSSWAFRAPSLGTHLEVPMSAFEVMRRASLGVFGAVALAFASAPVGAFALSRAVSGIKVDVGPLRANAGDPTAAWVARALPGALAQALTDVGRAGAPISVRIDYVILGPSSGGAQFGGATPDQMIGEVVVGGIAHELRASTSYYPMAVDQPHFEQANYDRVFQLSRAFAYWAARGYSGT